MPIFATRAKDYGFPETSVFVTPDSATGDVGVNAQIGAADVFMGPVSLITMTVTFQMGGGSPEAAYLKVYDAISPMDVNSANTLIEPLWIIQLYNGASQTLTFPDGYAFSSGLSIRATKQAGTGDFTTDTDVDGSVIFTAVGRKS